MSVKSINNFNSRNCLSSYVSNTSNNQSNGSCISDDENCVPIDTLKRYSLLNQHKLPHNQKSPEKLSQRTKAITFRNNSNKLGNPNININKLEMIHPKPISKDDSCYNIETIISMSSSRNSEDDI